MRVFAIGIELAHGVPVDCPQSGDARELDRPATSAALVISSAAVRTSGMRRSDAGMVLTRCAIASRRDASLTPRAAQ